MLDPFSNLNIDLFLRIPFDWKNPTGYLVADTALILCGGIPLQYVACFIFLPFGVFMFQTEIVKDLERMLHTVNKMARAKTFRMRMYKKLSQFIRLHADTKQLSE